MPFENDVWKSITIDYIYIFTYMAHVYVYIYRNRYTYNWMSFYQGTSITGKQYTNILTRYNMLPKKHNQIKTN